MRSLFRRLRAPCRRRTYAQKPSGYWRKAGAGGTRARLSKRSTARPHPAGMPEVATTASESAPLTRI
eukprot:718695-Amphidinium_carterae.1